MKEPISFYKYKNGLRFYLINCGQGLTHLIIYPDDTVMLYDCNLVEDDENKGCNKNAILNLLHNVIPYREDENGNKRQWIDIFVNSHRDIDHIKGLKDINNEFPIHSIWDSGQSGESTENPDYKYYMGLRNRLKEKSKDNLLVPTPSSEAYRKYGTASVYVLSDAKDYVEESDEDYLLEFADRVQHTNCLVLLVTFAGRKMLLTGDSDWKAWKENIIPNFSNMDVNYENADILIASHHGSRTFFTNKDEIDVEKYPNDTYIESIKLINPKVTLISCGKKYDHPHEDAMALYKEYTSCKQVFVTKELGTFCGLITNDGNFSITPDRFYNKRGNIGKRIELRCKTNYGLEVHNGDTVSTGCTLKFSIIGYGGVLEGDTIDIWEVCNSGYDSDDEHHEIYFKEKRESDGKNAFSRELSYTGIHLLRCELINISKSFMQQIVFVVCGK